MFVGLSIFDFCLFGSVIKVDNTDNYLGKCRDKIIILKDATPDVILLFNEALCVLCEYGGLTSHLALLAREMSIPCVVGIEHITDLCDDTWVRIESKKGKGIIYEIEPV